MLWACGLYSGCFQVNVRATKCPRWLPEATWSVCWFPNGHVTYQKLTAASLHLEQRRYPVEIQYQPHT